MTNVDKPNVMVSFERGPAFRHDVDLKAIASEIVGITSMPSWKPVIQDSVIYTFHRLQSEIHVQRDGQMSYHQHVSDNKINPNMLEDVTEKGLEIIRRTTLENERYLNHLVFYFEGFCDENAKAVDTLYGNIERPLKSFGYRFFRRSSLISKFDTDSNARGILTVTIKPEEERLDIKRYQSED